MWLFGLVFVYIWAFIVTFLVEFWVCSLLVYSFGTHVLNLISIPFVLFRYVPSDITHTNVVFLPLARGFRGLVRELLCQVGGFRVGGARGGPVLASSARYRRRAVRLTVTIF